MPQTTGPATLPGFCSGILGVDVGLMLGYLQPRLRHIEHLSLLHPRRHPRCEAGLAMRAMGHFMAFDLVRFSHRTQRVALMPGLPAALLA
jgi:hypothetical protein